MKLSDLKTEIQKYQYLEDTNIIDVSVASIIANRLKLSDPVWLIIIGASSGGKSQIIRPISLSDGAFIHKVDDITENTFLSGAKTKGGGNTSLLLRPGGVGNFGIISISDLTILLSKSGDARGVIMSQFRALFDGEMTKHSGSMDKPLHWEGYLGVIAGSTPSVYTKFEEFSDLGERFIYYRMKEFDGRSATRLALSRKITGQELNKILADKYGEYMEHVVKEYADKEIPDLSDNVMERLTNISSFAENVRTSVTKDFQQNHITRIPVPAYPMRVALQLVAIARALSIMKHNECGSYELEEPELSILDWVGYSLANEEKRACLKILASIEFGASLSTQSIADIIGLDTSVVGSFLQNLSAVGIIQRSALGALLWTFKNKNDYDLVRRIEHIEDIAIIEERDLTNEEEASLNELASENFEVF